MSLPNNTQLLAVYIEAEDYRKLKLLGSNSRGMSKIVRALIKAYLARAQAPDLPPELLQEIDDGA
jgi:hypothetical protein